MDRRATRSARLPSTWDQTTELHGGTSSQRCGPCCKIVHARVRWLGRQGVIENEFMLNWCSVYSWWQPSILLFAWKAARLPACVPSLCTVLCLPWRDSYEPCANREFPLSRLPYLKNRMAAIVISTVVSRYWVGLSMNTYEKASWRGQRRPVMSSPIDTQVL